MKQKTTIKSAAGDGPSKSSHTHCTNTTGGAGGLQLHINDNPATKTPSRNRKNGHNHDHNPESVDIKKNYDRFNELLTKLKLETPGILEDTDDTPSWNLSKSEHRHKRAKTGEGNYYMLSSRNIHIDHKRRLTMKNTKRTKSAHNVLGSGDNLLDGTCIDSEEIESPSPGSNIPGISKASTNQLPSSAQQSSPYSTSKSGSNAKPRATVHGKDIRKHVMFNIRKGKGRNNKNMKIQKIKAPQNLTIHQSLSPSVSPGTSGYVSTPSTGRYKTGKALEVLGLTPSQSHTHDNLTPRSVIKKISTTMDKARSFDIRSKSAQNVRNSKKTPSKSKTKSKSKLSKSSLKLKTMNLVRGKSNDYDDSEYVNMDHDDSPGTDDDDADHSEFVTPGQLDLNQYSDTIERNFATAVELIDRTKEKSPSSTLPKTGHRYNYSNSKKVRFGSNKFYKKRLSLKRKSLSNPIILNTNDATHTIQEEDSKIDQTMFDYSDNEDDHVGDLKPIHTPTKRRRPLRNFSSAPVNDEIHLDIPSPRKMRLENTGSNKSQSPDSGFIYEGDYDDYDRKQQDIHLEATPELVTDDEWKDGRDIANIDPYARSNSKSKSKSKVGRVHSLLGLANMNIRISDVEPINVDQVMMSLNVLASHGFCSRNSINSVHQLKLYQKQEYEKHKQPSGGLENNEFAIHLDALDKFNKRVVEKNNNKKNHNHQKKRENIKSRPFENVGNNRFTVKFDALDKFNAKFLANNKK